MQDNVLTIPGDKKNIKVYLTIKASSQMLDYWDGLIFQVAPSFQYLLCNQNRCFKTRTSLNENQGLSHEKHKGFQ